MRIGIAEAIAALRGRGGVEADVRAREDIELALSPVNANSGKPHHHVDLSPTDSLKSGA